METLVITLLSLLLLVYYLSPLPHVLNFLLAFIFTSFVGYFSIVNNKLCSLDFIIKAIFQKDSKSDYLLLNTDDRTNLDERLTQKLRELTSNIVNEFILSWYNTVSYDETFIKEISALFEYFFNQLRHRVEKIDRSLLTKAILSMFLKHYDCYKQSKRICDQQIKEKLVDDAHLLEAYEKLNGHLAMSLNNTQTNHQRSIVVVVLKGLLPDNYILTGTSLYVVRELIAKNCLESLISMLADPAWIRKAICDILDDDDDAVINEQSNSDVQDKNITDDNFEEDLVNFKSLPDTKKIPCEQKPNKEHKSTESSPETYCKLPNASRFENLQILETIETQEVHDLSKKYTLYKISYQTEIEENEFTFENRQVCRRFREFVNLHDRLLNKSPALKKAMKTIKGPSKTFPMAIGQGNMDKSFIEKRKYFLQEYLRHLCHIPVVECQPELSEFLALDSDPRIAFVGKPTEILPRIDKMFISAVSNIRDKFNNNQEGNQSNNNSQMVQKIRRIVTGSRHKTSQMDEMFGHVTRTLTSGGRKNEERWTECGELLGRRLAHKRQAKTPSGRYYESAVGVNNDDEQSIALLLCRCLGTVWSINKGEQTLVYILLGKYLQSISNDTVGNLTSVKKWTYYIEKLQSTLWNEKGEWVSTSEEENATYKSEQETLDVLKKLFPESIIAGRIGEEEYCKGIQNVLNSIQNASINRHLVYHLIDCLLNFVFPDLDELLLTRSNICLK